MMVEELTDFGPILGGVPRAERPHIENSCVFTEVRGKDDVRDELYKLVGGKRWATWFAESFFHVLS